MQTKYCNGCEKDVPIANFGYNTSTLRGISWKCAKCTLEVARKWKEKQGIKTYIYTIACPITNNIVYVGKTKTFNPLVRAGKHFSQYLTGKSRIEKWNHAMISINKKPIFEVIDIVENSEVYYWEVFYINLMKMWGFTLLNTIHNKI